MASEISLFLCGDVMTGRAIDQIMPQSVDPVLHERRVKSAGGYVRLAEKVNGPISQPVSFDYIWGDAIAELDKRQPAVRIVNLETAVTLSDEWLPKGINYRMHPDNVPSLTAAGIDCCVLANNHVLDWGQKGLLESLQVLRQELLIAGAGESLESARAPACLSAPGRRVLVFSAGTDSSGIPADWAATHSRPGVWHLEDLSNSTIESITSHISSWRKPGDVVVFSIHWGPNWGYRIPLSHRRFARKLIDSGQVDLIHGHSSHHPLGLEVHKGKLILYGCGDFINDYEGIPFERKYRSDLVLMYFPVIGADGRLVKCTLVPMQIRKLRLHRANYADCNWLARRLASKSPGWRVRLLAEPGGSIDVQWK